MDIKVLGGNGLHASETRAVKQMRERLRSSWYGYASLLVADDQGSMDIDTLVITHDRVLLVELKEWNGKLESSEGRWYLNGRSYGKSPYEIKRVHAIRLTKLLQHELQHKLGYFPRVEAHVVLCGSATPEHLSTSERRFVHTLDEFLGISDADQYSRLVEAAPPAYTDLFDRRGKPRPNSATNKSTFQQFFAGGRVRPKEFTHYSYTAEPTPWFKHRLGLFAEYKGYHQEAANDIALMRRWDFNSLGVGNATQEQWAAIALRESRVFSHAKAHERGLDEYLLRPLLPLSANDVAEDVTELYELRRTFSRLDEYLNKHGNVGGAEDRLDIVRALIAPFAELHGLGIAHRDIDLHNLWYASDQKSIIVSGFAASFFPERGTVSDLRELLQGSHVRLPEDVLRVDGDILDPFRQDVFMLAAAAYRILFPNSPLPQDEHGICQWQDPAEDLYGGQLRPWLPPAMAWEPSHRYANATEMLAALNEAVKPPGLSEEEAASTWLAITEGQFIKRGWGLFHLYSHFPPNQGENPGSGQTLKYRCTVDGAAAYLKVWQNVAPSPATHGLNRRVAAFRARAEKVSAGGIPTPRLLDFGLLESGGIFVVTRMEPGAEWHPSAPDESIDRKVRLAIALVKAVMVLHDQQIGHGDIHPGNLLVCSPDNVEDALDLPTVILLDLLDYGEQTQPFNVEYGPPNPAASDAFARDRFGVYKLVQELLQDNADDQLRQELSIGLGQPSGVPVSLEPLHDELLRLVEPQSSASSTENIEPIVVPWRRPGLATTGFALEQDDGNYHFNCKWDRRDESLLNCYVTGINGSITLVIDPEQRQIRDLRITTPIPLSDLVSASNRSVASISRALRIVDGERGNGSKEILDLLLSLEPVLSMLEAKFAPPTTPAEDEAADQAIAATEEIWRTLLDTEHESLLEVEVTGIVEENRNGQLQVPYRTANGKPIDFESDDRVFVTAENDDSHIATLDILETSPDNLLLEPTRAGIKKLIKQGSILRLESIQSKASRDRKAKAMERVLERASVIPDLIKYFEPRQTALTKEMASRPTEERIRDLYDSSDHKLNARQVAAFKELVERGPVCVLQGPPGTGKTTFVGAFIHYLFSELRVRNVLLVGQSHTAVDAVAKKARSVCHRHELALSVVRLGQERMLATEMLDAHSRAIQRQMRHSFHREYEHRIEIFSEKLGLPSELTAEVAALHRTLDGMFASIRRYEGDLAKAISDSANDELRSRIPEMQAQLDEVKALSERIIYQKFPDHAAALLAAADPWEAIVVHVSLVHGVNNPAALSRLRSLLSLSQEWLSVLHAGQANYDQFLVQTRQLVCGTLVGMGHKQLGVAETEFDWVIVDEAARAQASELMIPLQSGRRILLVGDHKQLPPVYEQSHVRAASRRLGISEEKVRQTDFERAFQVTRGVTLDTQYRMVEPIGELVSHCFYKDDGVELRTGRSESAEWYAKLPYPLDIPVAWIDSGAGPESTGEEERGSGRYVNLHEAQLVMRLLQRLTEPRTIEHLRSDTKGALHPIGVITMYREQKNLLEKELSKAEWASPLRSMVRIDTVDSYQGQENPFIILSLVRDNLREEQGFMWDPSRINVSLSRAQERLAIVGAARMWRRRNKSDPLGRVLQFIEERRSMTDVRYAMTGDLPQFASPHEFDREPEDA
ncbi:nuclease [Xanthomonas campestris pv. raphani]|uniref:AAA domain-containing protein n=1 Tax=Xanthomonas campestris TaxID=339 RepID=UPI002B228F1C|nr:AAA domain-containing protein [Xanthomonas campestris]MEA9798434.1 AAA domain-containing protein [Xanthomonas campestris pv. raphani]MEA9947326.1 AAA domain-containing protein [Xanthomonas campestris pv. raphani]